MVGDGAWEVARQSHRTHQSAQIAAAALALVIDGGAGALTMAGIAEAAGVSRPTLYRYYRDLDAVLAGIADLVTTGDEALADLVGSQDDPGAAFATLAQAIAAEHDHRHLDVDALATLLPPDARAVLDAHTSHIQGLMVEVLRRGVADGTFVQEVDPDTDAPLLLGLLAAADPSDPSRAVALATRIIRQPATTEGAMP